MFTQLHVHTEYSLLDGMCRISRLVARAEELGMDSLAITDHGVMYGVIEFYQAAIDAGIKPIIGCEVYVAQDSRSSRNAGEKSNYHLVLLAKNHTGYENLIQLTTRAHLEGFYYRPRVDKELLTRHKQGLVALTSCLAGEIPQLIMGGRLEDAREAARWYQQTFSDFYLEIQRHPIPELESLNQHLIKMSKELGIPLVATNDTHYINREDASAHDLLLCIGTNSSVNDGKRMKMAGDFFYLKSLKEMEEQYLDIPEAIENASRIAEMCKLKLDFERLHLPEIDLPPGSTPDEYLAALCREGLPRRYPDASPEILQRLEYELDVIKKTQFANYFLVVWDIISFVRKQGILYGVRGSAAASIVLYCLGITHVDPIETRLVFERFLNIERKEMPDIDMDFQDDRRDEVIGYVSQKYGQDHVAQIITFGTLGAKAAIRDVGRALGMAYSDVDRVARLIPNALNMTLDRALAENTELAAIYQQDAIVRKLIDSAKRVEGIARHASTHAAGVVISKEPLTRHVPLQRSSRGSGDESTMTQFAMGDIARIGLLKMDFLGPANLTVLGKAKEIIAQNHGTGIDLYHLPMNDAKTYKLLSTGETAGVFQLEGAGMRRYIKQLKPSTFSDIAAMIALYRPGPMEHIPTFIDAKHGRKEVSYPHPALKKILEETYGVIVYQDQVLFIVQAFAGYSLGQADIFRKAMGKKIPEVMKKEKHNFITGAEKNGFSNQIASQVYSLIEPFAGYAFNKAHSVSYALIAYQTAYLKANYPAEYITAFLSVHAGNMEKVSGAIAESRRLGINVLRPDINRSDVSFVIEKGADGVQSIRFGLTSIKNVGSGAVSPIVAERNKGGEFKSIEDFCRRCDLAGVNRRVMESLIKAGAFDILGDRATLFNNVERILSLAQREQRLRDSGQSTMFDLFGGVASVPMPGLDLAPATVADREKSAWEKELMSVSFSELPFNPEGSVDVFCGQVDVELDGQSVELAGRVVSVRYLYTKDSRAFASAILADVSGQIEVMVWPKVYEQSKDLWVEGNELSVQGKVRVKDDRVQMSCDSVRLYKPVVKEAPAPPKPAPVVIVPPAGRRLIIKIQQTSDENTDVALLRKIVDVLWSYPGEDEVKLGIVNGVSVTYVKIPNLFTGYCPELHEQLVGLIGEDRLIVQEGKVAARRD